jgi:hypothetical protein
MPQVEVPAIHYFLNDLPEGLRQAMCDHTFTTAWAVRGRPWYANSRSFTRI